jgi:hypothetical protein
MLLSERRRRPKGRLESDRVQNVGCVAVKGEKVFKFSIGLSLARLGFLEALVLVVSILSQNGALLAQENVDVVEYFQRTSVTRGAGLARKTKLVDVRSAKSGEVIVTMIEGEGKETQSPPAKIGDMVVRNRCAETGNEEFLVIAESFSRKYEGPIGSGAGDGWLPYRPFGMPMRFVVVAEQDGEFSFVAPWGQRMIARPGDSIVQDPENTKDTYRVAKAAFACTYEIDREPQR